MRSFIMGENEEYGCYEDNDENNNEDEEWE